MDLVFHLAWSRDAREAWLPAAVVHGVVLLGMAVSLVGVIGSAVRGRSRSKSSEKRR